MESFIFSVPNQFIFSQLTLHTLKHITVFYRPDCNMCSTKFIIIFIRSRSYHFIREVLEFCIELHPIKIQPVKIYIMYRISIIQIERSFLKCSKIIQIPFCQFLIIVIIDKRYIDIIFAFIFTALGQINLSADNYAIAIFLNSATSIYITQINGLFSL